MRRRAGLSVLSGKGTRMTAGFEERVSCEECGSEEFAVYYDSKVGALTVRCAKCGRSLGDLR